MKKLCGLSTFILGLTINFCTLSEIHEDNMWYPVITNLYVDISGGSTSVDFYYTLDPDGIPFSNFKFQVDDHSNFSSLLINLPLNSKGTIQNIDISAIGYGNLAYWRITHKSTQLASALFKCP